MEDINRERPGKNSGGAPLHGFRNINVFTNLEGLVALRVKDFY
jgi:hypothetical protein